MSQRQRGQWDIKKNPWVQMIDCLTLLYGASGLDIKKGVLKKPNPGKTPFSFKKGLLYERNKSSSFLMHQNA